MSEDEEWYHRSLGHAECGAWCDTCHAQRGTDVREDRGKPEAHLDLAIFASAVAHRGEGKVVSEQKGRVKLLVGRGREGEISHVWQR